MAKWTIVPSEDDKRFDGMQTEHLGLFAFLGVRGAQAEQDRRQGKAPKGGKGSKKQG